MTRVCPSSSTVTTSGPRETSATSTSTGLGIQATTTTATTNAAARPIISHRTHFLRVEVLFMHHYFLFSRLEDADEVQAVQSSPNEKRAEHSRDQDDQDRKRIGLL